MTALFKNRTMVQASSLGPNKHKRGRLRYLGEILISFNTKIKIIKKKYIYMLKNRI